METTILRHHFNRIGAQIDFEVVPEYRRQPTRSSSGARNLELSLDILEVERDEQFLLRVREDVESEVGLFTLNIRPDLRHLLLMIKRPNRQHEKFLCGHDERHWFVAGVKPNVVHVLDAMNSLKPLTAQRSQNRNNVRKKNLNRRRNAGFIRQGEWFFIPDMGFRPDSQHMILRNEPLARPNGKPHMVEEIYRTGGELVYVSGRAPRGISKQKYEKLIKRNSKAARANWRVMRRNPVVYARGKVRHPDHATLNLPFWHRVSMNEEPPSASVAFLD